MRGHDQATIVPVEPSTAQTLPLNAEGETPGYTHTPTEDRRTCPRACVGSVGKRQQPQVHLVEGTLLSPEREQELRLLEGPELASSFG